VALGPALLADDDAPTRAQLRGVLGRMGFLCLEVGHGHDALACLLRPRLLISLLVIDAGLRGAAELLTTMHAGGDPPVLIKPIDDDRFAHTVAALFSRQIPPARPAAGGPR
jgi:DNA-binding response OmpR family regulator